MANMFPLMKVTGAPKSSPCSTETGKRPSSSKKSKGELTGDHEGLSGYQTMTSAPPPLASSKETTNYIRLCLLLVNVGSQALRDIFDRIYPPAVLHAVLARHPVHGTLKSLRKKKVVNPTQWGKLYPTIPSSVSSASFDITLLMVLLRNICDLAPPVTGWNSLPPVADVTISANIARMKYYCNAVSGHSSQASVDDATFNSYWQEISNAIVELAGASYGATIGKLKNECMDPDTAHHYRELVRQWKKDKYSIKEKFKKKKVPKKEKMSLAKQFEDEGIKMEVLTEQDSESKNNPPLDINVIKRDIITDEGDTWNLQEAAAFLTFHQGAVPTPLVFTCSLWDPTTRSPPIDSNELLVSNVIELSHDGPTDLKLSGDGKGSITVALLHNASDLKGYEVVIKRLVDPESNEWKDLETKNMLPASAAENPGFPDWPQYVEATCTLSLISSFAAIWRLKSFTFSKQTSVAPKFTCVVPDYPDISVEVPLSSVPVDQDFSLTLKVQEFPRCELKEEEILVGPVLHISNSQNIAHLEPITIKLPFTLRERKVEFAEPSNGQIRILHLESESKPQSWTDITDQLEEPVIVTDGKVAFKVKNFSRFCPFSVLDKPLAHLKDLACHLSVRCMPQYVKFLTCLAKTNVPGNYGLLLYCYPNFLQDEVYRKLSSYDVRYKGEGTSMEPLCIGDKILVDLVPPQESRVILRFFGNDVFHSSALVVPVSSKGVPQVEFKSQELQQCSTLLCQVTILPTLPASQTCIPEPL